MQAYIGLGSNLGERETMIRLALDDLARLPGTQLVRASGLATRKSQAQASSQPAPKATPSTAAITGGPAASSAAQALPSGASGSSAARSSGSQASTALNV